MRLHPVVSRLIYISTLKQTERDGGQVQQASPRQPLQETIMAPYTGPRDLLAAPEVAARLSICVRTLRRLVVRGVFPQPIRFGPRHVRWKATDVQRYLDSLKPGT
jgi:excisionase family DNA binding protein